MWDIADKFGDTNLLVTNMAQANDLATCLAGTRRADAWPWFRLCRALADRGCAALGLPAAQRAGPDARAQLGGEIKYLSQGEIEARNRGYSPYSVETWRSWEYWANKAAAVIC